MYNLRRNRFYIGRQALRSADQDLIPAIVSCQCAIVLVCFSIFFFVAGLIVTITAADSRFSDDFFKESMERQARLGHIFLIVGGVLISTSITLAIIAFVVYRKHEGRRRMNIITGADNPEVVTEPVPVVATISGAYPSQPSSGFMYTRSATLQPYEPVYPSDNPRPSSYYGGASYSKA